MMIYAPTVDPAGLVELRADVAQLIRHISVPVRVQVREGLRRRYRWRVLDQPSLLDQLRQAAGGQGGRVRGPERRQAPRSRPPGSLDAIEALAALSVDLSGWRVRLALPGPSPRLAGPTCSACVHRTCQATRYERHAPEPDWHKTVLAQLAGVARHQPPDEVKLIASDVDVWWHAAAVHSGWTPRELLELRRGQA